MTSKKKYTSAQRTWIDRAFVALAANSALYGAIDSILLGYAESMLVESERRYGPLPGENFAESLVEFPPSDPAGRIRPMPPPNRLVKDPKC